MVLSLRSFLWVLPVLALTACSDFMAAFGPRPKPVTVSRAVQTEQYMLNMALLELALAKEALNTKTVQSQVKALNAYAAGNKKNKKETSLTVLALKYKMQDGEKQIMLTPIPADKRAEFVALKKTMQAFSAVPHTLYDVRAYVVTLVPAEVSAFAKDDMTLLRQQLKTQQERIMDSATALSAPGNARLQLDLVRFFMQNRSRDAAYLALENAKETLASMAEDEAESAATLSKEAATLEESLHREMPYRL